MLTRTCREYLFNKVVLIYQEKTTSRSIYFLGNYDWGVDTSLKIITGELFFKGVYIYGDRGNSFQETILTFINK